MNTKNNKSNKNNIAFLFRDTWYHRKKVLLEDGTVKYGRLGGFETQEAAEESYYKCLKEFENQNLLYIGSIINKEIMLKDYLKYWFEKVYSARIKSTTQMTTSYTIYNLIIPNIQYDIKLKFITTEYLDELLERTSKIGKSTANISREILFLAFKDAVLDGYITSNPVINTKLYKREKTKITILKKDDIKKFLEITSKDVWYFEILLALFCGLRKGEILGLKYNDFNLVDKTLKISRQLCIDYKMKKEQFEINSREYKERETKTENSNRSLRLPKLIIEELAKRKKTIECNKKIYKDKYYDNDYVCCQENGKPRGITSLNTYIKRICLKNGLPHITVHGLRHMYATILIEQGIVLAKISGLLGHSSIHTTFDYYCDVMGENEKITAFMNNTFVVGNKEDVGEEEYEFER